MSVKSCRAVSVEKAEMDSLGFIGDRRLMLVEPAPTPLCGYFEPNQATHRFVSQRQYPALATINVSLPSLSNNNNSAQKMIQLSTDDNDSRVVRIDVSSSVLLQKERQRYRSTLWDDVVDVVDVGDEASHFIQSILKQNSVRLVSMIPQTTKRPLDNRYVPKSALTWTGDLPDGSLTDGFPLLLATTASLDELNARLTKKGKQTLPMSRFRPNIVLTPILKEHADNNNQPFDEDYWRTISVGDNNTILHVVKACPRCKQSTIDQVTGDASDTEPLETLKEFHAYKDDVFFGQNIVLGNSSNKTIQVGDTVKVLSRGSPIWGC